MYIMMLYTACYNIQFLFGYYICRYFESVTFKLDVSEFYRKIIKTGWITQYVYNTVRSVFQIPSL